MAKILLILWCEVRPNVDVDVEKPSKKVKRLDETESVHKILR